MVVGVSLTEFTDQEYPFPPLAGEDKGSCLITPFSGEVFTHLFLDKSHKKIFPSPGGRGYRGGDTWEGELIDS